MKKFLVVFCVLLAHSLCAQPKGYFMGFTYNDGIEINPFTSINCAELPDLYAKSNKDGFFELMLDTGTYHFNFAFGDSLNSSGFFAENVPVKIKENEATIQSIRMYRPHYAYLDRLSALWIDQPYFHNLEKEREKLGLDYDSLCKKINDHFFYDDIRYDIVNVEMTGKYNNKLAVDINLPAENVSSPFGCIAYCFIEFENKAGQRDLNVNLPEYSLHEGELVLRLTFDRFPDLASEEFSIILAVKPNAGGYANAWKQPKEFMWIKKTVKMDGMNKNQLLAYDMAIHKMVVDSLEKCPEKGRGHEENILKQEYGIPVFNPNSVYEWNEFSQVFCPMMDSLIEIKLGAGIFKDISRQVFIHDSLELRKKTTVYPSFEGGEEALTTTVENLMDLDSNVCYPQKGIRAEIEILVDSVGNISYRNGEMTNMYSYLEDTHRDFDTSNCNLLIEELKRIVPLLPNWIPALDGYEEPKTLVTKMFVFYNYKGEFHVNYWLMHAELISYPTVCGNWRPP